jgi:Na+/phosphate symporter
MQTAMDLIRLSIKGDRIGNHIGAQSKRLSKKKRKKSKRKKRTMRKKSQSMRELVVETFQILMQMSCYWQNSRD